jgi:hypothetical protein
MIACAGAALMVLGAVGAGPGTAPAIAQENLPGETGVYGRNVVRADWPGGSFRMIGPNEWGQFDAAGALVRRFVETSRDDWAVYFSDPDSGYQAHIDMLYNVAFLAEPGGGGYQTIGTITSATPRSDMPRIDLPPPPSPNHELYARRFGGTVQQQARVDNPPASAPWAGGAPVEMGGTAPPPRSQPDPWQQPAPGSGQDQAPARAQGDGGFDPFAPSAPATGNVAGGSSLQGSPPPWQQQPRQEPRQQPSPPSGGQSSPPPWMQQDRMADSRGGGAGTPPPWASNTSNGSGTSGTGFGSDPRTAQVEPHALIEGVWVELNAISRPEGDGTRKAITWSTPQYLRFVPINDNQVAFLTNNPGFGWNVLNRQAEDRYSGNGSTVTITERRGSYFMEVSGGGLAGSYEIARTADGTPSRERFDPSDRDNRRGLFNQDGLTREWNTNFQGFDGLEINLFDQLAGRRGQIFKQPGNVDYAVDDNLNLGLPFGLRGFRTRMSSSRQMETLVTNAAKFQQDMSMNFGGGIATPKASFGANYSREQTSGTRQRNSTMSAVGYARIERYTLVLDEPNAELSSNFRTAIDNLADGRTSAQTVVDTFGTHYAKAISYGGLGKAEKTMTSMEVAEYLSTKQGVSGNVGAKGASLSGGFSEGRSSDRSTESVFTRDEFVAVGGSGSMTSAGWQVSDSDTVPVRYDLRRLSDLVNPILFEIRSAQESDRYFRARQALRAEIDRRMVGAPDFANRYVGPAFYEIELERLRCIRQGDDATNTVTLKGSMQFNYTDDNGRKQITVFNNAAGEAFTCGGAGKPLGQKLLVVMTLGSANQGARGFGSYGVLPNMTEVDDGPPRSDTQAGLDSALTIMTAGLRNRMRHNADDRIDGSTMMMPLLSHADGSRRSVQLGGGTAPTIAIDYTIRGIN